jgi:DNA-binding NarL/FixJ family response regulator
MPDARILVITDDHDPQAIAAVISSGIGGVITKSRAPSWFVLEAAYIVGSGHGFVADSLLRDSFIAIQRHKRLPGEKRVTPREREILNLLADGLSDESVARQLGVATTTVQTHIGNLLHKLGVSSRFQLGMHAVQCDLLETFQVSPEPSIHSPT